MSRPSYARNALTLGLITAVGPFAIDMYLPALPAIEKALGTTQAAVQMTLMSYFLGFGASQIFFGPLSDMFGRKLPLFIGLGLFILGALGCALSPNIETLIAARFLQGIGGACIIVPRAIVRDLHTGIEATRLMTLIMLVFSVSPILAPLTGSALIVPFGWRAVFIAVALAAAFAVFLTAFVLPETRPKSKRIKATLGEVLKDYGKLLRNWRFLGLTSIGGLGFSSFLAFISTSSFVYIGHYGLTPTQYSFAFASNAMFFIGASQFAAKLGARFTIARVITTAVTGFAFFCVLLTALVFSGYDNLFLIIGLLYAANACLGLVIPTSMVLALDDQPRVAGMAAALGGTLQMILGGATIAIISQFNDGTARPMVAGIAACALLSFTIAKLTLRKKEWAPQLAE